MGAKIFGRGRSRRRSGTEVPVSPMRQRAHDAAEALHSDNSARWFTTTDVFPIYNYLYDYYLGRPDDARLRRLAREALDRLHEFAGRLEASAVATLPPEWESAKSALAQASDVLAAVTGP